MQSDREIISQVLKDIEVETHPIEIIGRVCEKLESFHHLTGCDKKRLTLDILKMIMDDNGMSKQETDVIMNISPLLIDDLVYMANTGSKEFKKKKNCCCQKVKSSEKTDNSDKKVKKPKAEKPKKVK